MTACMIVSNLVDFALEKLNFNAGQATLVSPETRSMLEEAYAFYRTVDVAYQTYIAKKSSSMTSDSNEVLFKLIGNVYEACAKMMPDFALDIAQALEIDVPQDTETELMPALIRTRWRLQVLKKQIMEGRMELRVNGIDTMQADLVTLFRRYIVDVVDGAENPIIRSTVHFIKSSKMLEYIVGIDSHEQLISRGPNIVGFLIVADAYTDEDTDTLWHAVTDGQDSRVVPDVLKMLTQTFSYHQSSHALLYLCQKLLELPLHRFDLTMTDYCDKLLVNIKEKAIQSHAPDDDETRSQALAIPFQLCVRLIRETPTVPELTPEQKSWLQQFASKHLASLLEMGLHDDLKIGMYKECIKDISACNDFALGSIRAVYALLRAAYQADITRLIDDFDLTRLVVNNLGKFCDSVPAENPPAQLLIELYSRIQLLNFIIEQYPQSLSADLCGFFWRKVFESSTLDDRFKNLVWDMLTRVAATAVQSQERNTFLERIFRDYLPTVTPERYTSNVLNLTTQSVIYGMTHDSTGTPAPGEVIAFPGMDQLWHIISTALPHTIEQQAIDRAIELYLDHPLLLNFDIKSVQATHIALVNRCINEITAAASRLKEAFSRDMRLNDDDDDQNEKELAADELRFSRHLLFLRQLIRGLKSRPQYSAGRRQSPELPPDEGTECGQVLDINYQAYNGSARSSVQTLRMSENCTAQQLLEKLKKVTGFTSFTTVMSGGKVNWDALSGQTVRDAGFGQSGLLMISKHPDTPTVPDSIEVEVDDDDDDPR
ncbi:Phosphoacetylglucosamine Mutase, partial [Ascosphaera pollenicola]